MAGTITRRDDSRDNSRDNGRGRRGDGSITERTRADGTIVYDIYWQFPDPVTGVMRRTSKRGFASRREAAKFLKNLR